MDRSALAGHGRLHKGESRGRAGPGRVRCQRCRVVLFCVCFLKAAASKPGWMDGWTKLAPLNCLIGRADTVFRRRKSLLRIPRESGDVHCPFYRACFRHGWTAMRVACSLSSYRTMILSAVLRFKNTILLQKTVTLCPPLKVKGKKSASNVATFCHPHLLK